MTYSVIAALHSEVKLLYGGVCSAAVRVKENLSDQRTLPSELKLLALKILVKALYGFLNGHRASFVNELS